MSVRVMVLGLLSMATLHAQQQPTGAPIFASQCAGCHGVDGRGGEHAPDIATAADVRQLADSALTGIVENGISGAGMPAFGALGRQKVNDVVAYLRILQGRGNISMLPGDPDHGEALFFGKAQCSDCHMVNGKGGFIGSDLSSYGVDATADQMRAVILHPDKSLPPPKKATTVVTSSGQTIVGMLRVSDNFSLSIQTLDGSFHFIPRSEIAQVDFGSRSLMPAGSALSSSEVDDLVSYLLRPGAHSSQDFAK